MVTAIAPATIGRSRGLAGLGSLPAFELPAADGGSVRSWTYRSREHLVVALAGPEPDGALIEQLSRRERDVRAEDASVLVILQTEPERAAQIWEHGGHPGRALLDADGRVHAKLGTAGAAPELLVVDRDGTIYWRAALSEAPPARLLDEAISWLQYMNILEHECGTCVPAWPDEDLL